MNIISVKTLCIAFAIVLAVIPSVEGDGLIEVFKWKQMDFYERGNGISTRRIEDERKGNVVFPGRYKRFTTSRDDPINLNPRWNNEANNLNTSSYVPYNNVPMGVTHYNGRLFITMPRRRLGIPSTLNYVDLRRDGTNPSPKLHAYPDFETNRLNADLTPNPGQIISVYRTTVDECNRLWFIDTGMLELPDNRMQVQRPTIWVMDLTTDRVIRRFEIPTDIVDTGRGLASIAVDVTSKQCAKSVAYIPDLVNNKLFVFSLENNRIWAFTHNYFKFDPLGGDLSIGGQTFRWDDGIFSVTLGPIQPSGYRNVYFHPMASNNEFVVSSEVLKQQSNAARSDHGSDFQLLGSRGVNRQSTMHDYDPRTGIIFYAEIQRNGVGCWNTKQPFTADNHGTVARDARRMIYPSDLTIDADGYIWVMTNSMPIFIYANLDPNIYNFRVWKQNVRAAARNTVCE